MTQRWTARPVSRRGALALGAAATLAGCTDPSGPSRPDGPDRPSPAPGPVRAQDWSRLAGRLQGSLARPGDPSYDQVRLVENPAFDGARPLAVLSAASADDVAAGVAFAREHDLPVAVRSGGHSYPGWSAGDGRLVLDVRPLGGVRLGRDGRTATVGAGAPLIRVYDGLAAAGRGLAAGSCPTVGIAGLTLGGGQGIVGRAHGLTCDAVTSLRVVTAEGRVVTARADEEPDLFWALRGGGGGHLGVVTSFTFDTFPAPDLSTAYLQWPLASLPDVLPAWEQWAPTADPALWSTLRGLAGTRHPSGPALAVSAVWAGDDTGLATRLAALLAQVPPPVVDQRQRRSFLDVVRAYAGCSDVPADQCRTGPGGTVPRTLFAGTSNVAYRSLAAAAGTVVDRLTDAQGSGLVEAGVSLDALGGRIGDPAPGDTAFVHRRALATVQHTATYTAGDRATAVGFTRGAREALTRTAGNHAYVNYADDAVPDPMAAYFGANAGRLEQVRADYDPDGFFRQARS